VTTALTRDFPAVLEIELNRRCNLGCRMCQRQVVQAAARMGALDFAVLDMVLGQCAGHAPQVNLGGLGESLLERRLPLLLERIKRHDGSLTTGFNTNGMALQKRSWPWLLDGRVDYLTISLKAPDADSYRWLIGSDAYLRIERQARRFLEAKGCGRPPLTTVHVFALPRFAAATPAFVERWQGLADFVQVREFGNWAGKVDTTDFGAVLPRLGRCDRPALSLAIDVDGGYHRCCATFAFVQPRTSIFEVPIADHWQGAEMQQLRHDMRTLEFSASHPCRSCSGRAIPANTTIERAAHAALGAPPLQSSDTGNTILMGP
jgi:hypothetical protein